MLTIGQSLPEFKGEAILPNGEFSQINFSDYKGKWIVLFFYPFDFTFVCPTEILGFNEIQSEFTKLNTTVLGASIDSVHCHKAWIEHGLGKIDFPLIGDITRELSQSCGVLAAEGFANRVTFIINPAGKVESVSANSSNVGRSTEETLRVLQALQTGGLAPCGWKPGQALLKSKNA
jgi:peroxiredoxin (alkyl hydroperoxide reductase subunit C)